MPEILDIIKDMDDIQVLEFVDSMNDRETDFFMYSWDDVWSRKNQREPIGDWTYWLILAGRGWGKTRTGAEWIRKRVYEGAERISLVAPTSADVRDLMVEGVSGVMSVFPEAERPRYEPSKRRVTFHTGAVATTYSGDEPDRLRGANADTAWADELCAFRYPEAFDMLQLGLRIGDNPRCIITTTPKPNKQIIELMKYKSCYITRGSTYDNRRNLSRVFFESIIQKYEGTRLGRQELHAEILEDVEGALWNIRQLDDLRVKECPHLVRVVVAIDPSTTSNVDSAETGIVVSGLGADGKGYVLDDVSVFGTPQLWGSTAVKAYYKYKADRIVAEANNGGDMIEHVIRTIDSKVSYKKVWASRGKATRAEPVSALYEQGKVHHVGYFASLEEQMTGWVVGEKSPDRMDALVWSLTELIVNNKNIPIVSAFGNTRVSPWKV